MANYIIKDGELYHWGVKGMRWGVRRYQNSDGSLTDAGKRRRSLGEVIHDRKVSKKRLKNLKKAREARAKNKEIAAQREKDIRSGKIKAKDMTTAELTAHKMRLQLEKDYNDLVKQTKQTTRGRKFVAKVLDSTTDKLADSVVADLIAQTAKSFGTLGLNKALSKAGLGDEYKVFTNNKKKS